MKTAGFFLCFQQDSNAQRVGQVMIRKGFITLKELVSAIQDQMEEVVIDALSWKQGHFLFLNKSKPENEDILLDIKMDHLVLKGLQRIQASHEKQSAGVPA